MAKRPSFQFYPGDWLRDTALRSCSLMARGLWIDMICFMVEGYPYGYLKVGNKVILPVNLANMTGLTLEVVERLLQELRDADVFSVDEAGCIFSRRMVKDEQVRSKRASGGFLGGNPALKKQQKKVIHKVNLTDNLMDNLTPEDEEEDKEEEDKDLKEKKRGLRGKKEKAPKQQKIMVAPEVNLTMDEHNKLVDQLGAPFVQSMYAWYASYKIEKDYKTKSDYLSITRWVIKAVKEKQQSNGSATQQNQFNGRKPTGAELLAAQLSESLAGEGVNGGNAAFGVEIQPGVTLFPNDGHQ